jgi:hypothetical protein
MHVFDIVIQQLGLFAKSGLCIMNDGAGIPTDHGDDQCGLISWQMGCSRCECARLSLCVSLSLPMNKG